MQLVQQHDQCLFTKLVLKTQTTEIISFKPRPGIELVPLGVQNDFGYTLAKCATETSYCYVYYTEQ